MTTMTWHYAPDPAAAPIRALAEALSAEKPFPEALARILVQRGVGSYEEARHFFAPSAGDLHDPFLMRDMEPAVARLAEARSRGEKVMLLGDYDVDGTSAVTLLTLCCQDLGIETIYYIPDRYTEGYGVSYKGVDHAQAQGAGLIVALDCGIKSLEQVRYAKLKGIDFIICDHHTPGTELPAAVAVLDPGRPDCPYPNKSLTGCGVGLKLMMALASRIAPSYDALGKYADLVTLSIACDIVAITGENRIIAHLGLAKLRSNPLPGLKILMDQSKDAREWDISDLVFFVGPRINSAGRLHHASGAVEVLLGRSQQLASLAEDLQESNDARKDLDRSITEEALREIAADPGYAARSSTVLFNPAWHKGIIGIVASRLIEKHYRPTVLLTETEGKLVGSARSVAGFDLYAALDACSEHLVQFGGHRYAAGLTLKAEHYERFRERFESVVAEHLRPEQRHPVLEIDGRLRLPEIDERFVRILNRMEPFGPENRRPVFCAEGVEVSSVMIMKEDHVRFTLEQDGARIEAVGFFMADRWRESESRQLDIAFQPAFNTWNQQTRINLRLKDFKPSA
jgi:single-stranded-DNA-specific exonuclease